MNLALPSTAGVSARAEFTPAPDEKWAPEATLPTLSQLVQSEHPRLTPAYMT